MFYKWFQLLHETPNKWMRITKTTNDLCNNIVYLDHPLVKNNTIVALLKLHSKEIYSLIIPQIRAHLHHNNILKLCFPI